MSASASLPVLQVGEAHAEGTTIFSDSFTGGDGANWDSAKWATTSNNSTKKADIQSNQGRLYVDGSPARATSQMTAITDAEVNLTYRFNERTSGSFLRVFMRASGATGASQMPNAYRLEVESGTSTIKLQKFVNNAVTNLASFTHTQDANAQRVRFEVQGSSIKAKVWPASSSEPGSWSITATDTDTAITGAGVLQVAHSHSSGTHTVYIDDLAVSDPAGATPPDYTTAGGTPANVLIRRIHTEYGAHWIDIDIYGKDYIGNDRQLWAAAKVHTGALAGGTCVEFWHNINLFSHRTPDLITSCEANITRTYPSFWLLNQGGFITRLLEWDTTDPHFKGVNVCVTEQGSNRRIWGQSCFAGSSTYTSIWGNGTRQWEHPEPWTYDGVNYDTMLNNMQLCDGQSGQPSCKNIRWLSGDHWNHDLTPYDRVVDPGTMWSSYYGSRSASNRYLWIFQGDGNLVVYRVNFDGSYSPTWASGTDGNWGAKLRIQADGNLVIWRQETNDCIWHSNTWGRSIVRWANGHNSGFYGYRSDGSLVGIDNPQYC